MKLTEILRNLNVEQLTPMQQAVGEAYAQKGDLILLSPTGSGKTLAFLLPLVQSLRRGEKDVQAIVLVPSRELALQTDAVFKQMKTPFNAMACYGGRPAMEEHRTMRSLLPAVIIGTPGRINDHLSKGNIVSEQIRTLVVDEFDKCLELGFQEEMSAVINRLPNLSKRLLLSATNMDSIPSFVKLGGEDGKIAKLDFLQQEQACEARLHLQKVISPQKDKLETLYRLLCALGASSTLVFVNYRESVDRIAGYLKSKQLSCEAFHGGMEQMERERALYKFRNGSCSVLISTDLASRGLDIAGVDNVIHYHLPVSEEAFVHRNGRTARWDADGSSFLILNQEEQLPEYLHQDVSLFALPDKVPVPMKPLWTTLYIGKGKKDKINKVDIVGFLYKRGGLSGDDVGRVDVKEHYSFVAVKRAKVKNMFMLIRGEKMKGMKVLVEEAR